MLIIKEVLNKAYLKKFIDFPNTLYNSCEFYIAPLIADEINRFTATKNAAFSICDSRQFLCYQDNKIVGRIATICNHQYNESRHVKELRFTRFDVIDDFEVTQLLFDKVKEVAIENGCDTIVGPLGFSDLDKKGMLYDGFDQPNSYKSFYNFEYYNIHLKKLGFIADCKWSVKSLNFPDKLDPRLEKVSKFVLDKYNLKLLPTRTMDDAFTILDKGYHLMNDMYGYLYGYEELSDKQIKEYLQYIKAIISPEFVCGIVDESDKLIGFSFVVPSISKAFQKNHGRITINALLRVRKALKSNDSVDIYDYCILYEYQNKGVDNILTNELLKKYLHFGIKRGETNFEIETDNRIYPLWKEYASTVLKQYYCYRLPLNNRDDS